MSIHAHHPTDPPPAISAESAAALERPRGRPRRAGPGRAGHLGGQHGAAVDREGAPAGGERPAGDHHRIPYVLRRRPAARRPRRRPPLPTDGLPGRAGTVRAGVPCQRLRGLRRPTRRDARDSGDECCGPHAVRLVADHDDLRRRPAAPGPRSVGRGRQPRRRGGRGGWRGAHHLGQLAVDLLDQRPDRCRRSALPACTPSRRWPGPARRRCAASTCPALPPSSAG